MRIPFIQRWLVKLHPSHRPVAIAACAFGGALFVFLLAAFAYDKILDAIETTWRIHMVVPTGYRGWFVIREGAAGAVPVYGPDHFVRYEIPENGLLTTRDAQPFSMFKLSAEYAGGSKLPVIGFDGSEEKATMLHGGPNDADGNMYFFIGSGEEFRKQRSTDAHHEFLESVIQAKRTPQPAT